MTLDEKYMNIAISLAEKGISHSFPNPSVGCVILECDKDYKNEQIVGFGFTSKTGRPHAEANAIKNVKFKKKKKYICYSTLEPCAHIGRDDSCLKKILSNPIDEVVFSLLDPDLRTSGKSLEKLRKEKIKVRNGTLKSKSINLYKGYFMRKIQTRPFITLKIATSIDGKIAYPDNRKKWITNSLSRKFVHHIRSDSDGILIGGNTLRIDNPQLNCRIKGLEETSPIRIVISKRFNFSYNLKFFNNNKLRTIFFTEKNRKLNLKILKNNNIEIHEMESEHFSLRNILNKISLMGISNLLVEGGATIFGLFLEENLVDKIMIFRGNNVIGNEGLDAFNTTDRDSKNFQGLFQLTDIFKLENNHLEIFENKESNRFFKNIIKEY